MDLPEMKYVAMDAAHLPVVFRSDNHRGPPIEWANLCQQISKQETNVHHASFWAVMAMEILNAQVFDFGCIDDKDLRVESKRGGELWVKGYLKSPYRSCIFWYENVPDPEVIAKMAIEHSERMFMAQRYCTLLVEAPERVSKDSGWLPPVMMIADFLRIDEMRGPQRTAYALGGAAIVGHHEDAAGWIGRRISSRLSASRDPNYDGEIIGSLIDGVVGLSMVLSTKNVPLRVEEPSAKLNKKREASGKQPLVRVTHVDTRTYHEAIKNTHVKGTHASPVPHMRRGHLRNYADGHKVWIKDMLVNARSISEVHRDHYEVET